MHGRKRMVVATVGTFFLYQILQRIGHADRTYTGQCTLFQSLPVLKDQHGCQARRRSKAGQHVARFTDGITATA